MKFDPKEVTAWFMNKSVTGGKQMFEHMLLNAMTQIRKRSVADDDKLLVDWREGKCEVVMLWNGIEIPILEVCEEWDKQYEQMLGEKALELFDERLAKFQTAVEELAKTTDDIRHQLMKKLETDLGVKFHKDEWRS